MINSVGNQLGNRCVPQGPSNNNENFIQNKDTDGDGLLNAQELGAPEEDFVKIDTNGDGLADKEELTIAYINRNRSAHMGNRPNQFIKNKDADGDGLLNPEELGLSEEDFAGIDTNGDGFADKEELTIAYINKQQAESLDERKARFIEDKDSDGDGLLNAEELGAPEEDFAKIDKSGDGLADRVELAIAYQEINREPDAQTSEESERQGLDITV